MTQCEALMAIARRNGGIVTPAAVVAEARDGGSVLHGAFEWNDTVAAQRYRIIQAQHLIRECRVTVERGSGEKVHTYAFIGLSSDRGDDAANNPYRIAADVSRSEDLVAIAVDDALSQLTALKRRFELLNELHGVWEAVDAEVAKRKKK